MPTAENDCPVNSGVPECDTGPVGRVRFVGTELHDIWRELRAHAHREPRTGETMPHDDGPDSGEQERE